MNLKFTFIWVIFDNNQKVICPRSKNHMSKNPEIDAFVRQKIRAIVIPNWFCVPYRKFKVNDWPHNSIFLQPKNQSCVHLVCSRPTSHALQILRALLLMAPKDIRLRKDSVSVSEK